MYGTHANIYHQYTPVMLASIRLDPSWVCEVMAISAAPRAATFSEEPLEVLALPVASQAEAWPWPWLSSTFPTGSNNVKG